MTTITNRQRMDCIRETTAYTDRDAYISDVALSSIWGDDNEITDDLIATLGNIWDAAHRTVKDICRDANISQRQLAEQFCIPYRTVENWCAGVNECPIYTKLMMQQLLNLI